MRNKRSTNIISIRNPTNIRREETINRIPLTTDESASVKKTCLNPCMLTTVLEIYFSTELLPVANTH
jgi:hypothetical protein